MTLSLKEIYLRYVEWVSRNPQTTADIESFVKWTSYFLAGRISNSSVISELVYSTSNLIVLFNDNIIRKSQPFHSFGSADRLKTWLTVLEYSEVFIEVSSLQAWGSTGRWIVIAIIQLFKCIARLSLLARYKENIIQNPPIVPLKRIEVNNPIVELPPEGFTLKSGRVIRTVESAAPATYRTWKPPVLPKSGNDSKEDAVLDQNQFIGEILYVVKPLAHLAAVYQLGPQSWRPWLISLVMDLASLHLLKRPERPMSRRQRIELSRRRVSLLLYLLRSPFYERQSRDRLLRLLAACSASVPLVGVVLRPLAQYIPHWQKTYFYMWST